MISDFMDDRFDVKANNTAFQEQPDAYDRLVKEMVLDMRARPSDRIKTPEEIAQEERERLEQLEVLISVILVLTCSFLCIVVVLYNSW